MPSGAFVGRREKTQVQDEGMPEGNAMEDQIDLLMNELNTNRQTAVAFIKSKGRCIYCGIDLLSDWHNYQCSQLEHILPKAKYPDLEWNEDNCVLGCTACNMIKHNFDPLKGCEAASQNPSEYLSSHKEELIVKAREHIFARLPEMKASMKRVSDIICGSQSP